ncbi:MAG: hypothetical protein L0Y79_06490, partial [Chlorobi bacterium]|nr:hypothetical protein [Chlorobiota bacterium]
MKEKEVKNIKKEGEKTQPNGNFLRCINIDCVFNSSNERGAVRNTCNHPNVIVESRFADITIAICSEFRSKKDYIFEKPSTLIEKKTREKTEIIGKPDVGATTVEKVTTKELEQEVSHRRGGKTSSVKAERTGLKPIVIESHNEKKEELLPSEIYNLTDRPGTDFLILKKLYQPYTKRGLAGSIAFHIFMLFIMYLFLVPKEGKPNGENLQRIVIVEDLEMPKFNPPDIDKMKEEEKLKEIEGDVKDVRPKITRKNVTPKITRPKDNTEQPDTNKNVAGDTTKPKFDSTLISGSRDTSRIFVPDSLRTTFDQNDVGLKLWFPAGWKLIDNRQINLTQKEFNGVIISTDSLSEDPGAVNMFILIDDPQHSAYNKATYKNPFLMDDSVIVAYVTDPIKSSGKKFSTKYYLFTDPTGIKNIQVNVDFASQAMMEKYQ